MSPVRILPLPAGVPRVGVALFTLPLAAMKKNCVEVARCAFSIIALMQLKIKCGPYYMKSNTRERGLDKTNCW